MKPLTFTTTVTLLTFVFAGAALAEGACNYVQKNMFAGPFNVCEQPLTAEECSDRGTQDENSNASHSDVACSSENEVGTCDNGTTEIIYYDGEAMNLEIGCSFQSGEWSQP